MDALPAVLNVYLLTTNGNFQLGSFWNFFRTAARARRYWEASIHHLVAGGPAQRLPRCSH